MRANASATELVTQYEYDENGNLEDITDPLDGVTHYVYDEVDRLTSRTLPNGVVTTYGYDDRDRVLSVVHTGPLLFRRHHSRARLSAQAGDRSRIQRFVTLTDTAELEQGDVV